MKITNSAISGNLSQYRGALLAVAASFCAMPQMVVAQTDTADIPQAEPSVFDSNYITIGIGAAVGPSYEGSDDYVFFPLPAVQGSFRGIEFQPRQAGLAFDVIPDQANAKFDLVAGPVVRVRFDRTRQIKDAVVRQLGELDVAVELGGTLGVQANRLLNPYDSLTVHADARWDVAGAHKGMVIAPQLTYFTPVSRGAAVALTVSAEHVDDDYADYYFSISPAGTVASGLPTFQADGGWKNVSAGLLATVDLDGDLLNGGLALFAVGNYSRLLEDAKRSPVTSIRGDKDQWLGVVGIGYTF